MQDTKFSLSREEASAISDCDFFLIKNSATKKIMEMFGVLEAEMKRRIPSYDVDVKDLNVSSGKIFRGENYKLFPYILLDYPRLFHVNSVFAFRTMMWWGHEFSFTLHVQGEALEHNRKKLYYAMSNLKGKGVYYCVNDTPWQYYFKDDNYRLIDNHTIEKEKFFSSPFIKLSRKLSINEFDKAYDYCLETFDLFFTKLKEG